MVRKKEKQKEKKSDSQQHKNKAEERKKREIGGWEAVKEERQWKVREQEKWEKIERLVEYLNTIRKRATDHLSPPEGSDRQRDVTRRVMGGRGSDGLFHLWRSERGWVDT